MVEPSAEQYRGASRLCTSLYKWAAGGFLGALLQRSVGVGVTGAAKRSVWSIIDAKEKAIPCFG